MVKAAVRVRLLFCAGRPCVSALHESQTGARDWLPDTLTFEMSRSGNTFMLWKRLPGPSGRFCALICLHCLTEGDMMEGGRRAGQQNSPPVSTLLFAFNNSSNGSVGGQF